MSDVYIPGVKSRFNSEKIIEDLMRLERIPKERTERDINDLQIKKSYWQEVGKRIDSVRKSANFLYSFQNPFNERIANSTDDSVITASATRESAEQSYRFTVKQIAQADRYISNPLDEKMKIESGNYTFTVGDEKISINYRGGTLKDFVEVINRRGRDKISASLLAIQVGTKSLLIESKVTGEANRLSLNDDAASLALRLGMMEVANDTRREIPITENTVQKSGQSSQNVKINEGALLVPALSSASLPVGVSLSADSPVMLKLETSTVVDNNGIQNIPAPPPGPSIPASGSATYGGITIDNEPSIAPIPDWKPPAALQRHDDMAVLNLVFQDGTSAKLPPISDSGSPVSRQYRLSDIAQGRTIVSLNVENSNTHRNVSIANVEIFDPTATSGGLKPLNPVSTSRDAIITMEGIEITRPSNNISDIVPGLTINVKGVSDKPVEVKVSADREQIKESIISFVANYNRLIAELNVLTAPTTTGVTRDREGNMVPVYSERAERIVDELTYLTADESAAMKRRLGAFTGDTTLNSLKNNLLRTVSAPYPTDLDRELAILAQIGISTSAGSRGGYESSQLRGYLQIDEEKLDAALENKIPAVKQLFASDTSGDLIADTGVAVNVETLVKPFVDTGGIISLKSSTIDSRIKQDERRIGTMERQLEAKEQELKIQYARMESAYARMEQMSTSLDNFSQQNRGNR
ncbi:MAG: flagellar filament capping protein FliD [Treponema sp.]|jgi:flagellar hook-associated protein 2|nr:flagellar filament capping protein FliD [Treponema sp.]